MTVMEKFRAVAALQLGAGVRIGLSKEQAERRRHALMEEGKGVYMATLPVSFKAGESFGFAGELPKSLAALVEKHKVRKEAADVVA